MTDAWFGWDEHVPKHGRTEMVELPVLKYKGGIGISFVTEGRAEGMLMRPDLYGMTSIPDSMEVVVRRAGDCVEVVTRPRVPS